MPSAISTPSAHAHWLIWEKLSAAIKVRIGVEAHHHRWPRDAVVRTRHVGRSRRARNGKD